MSEFGKSFRRGLSRLMLRVLQKPRVVLYRLLSSNRPKGTATRFQPIQTCGLGTIEFGLDVKFGVFPSPYFFSTYAYLEARNPSASIAIGAGAWINNNFCVIAEHTCITIGKNCRIGANVEILDSDFHGMRVAERSISRPEWAKQVNIGNDVFIGSNVTILKGVSIGDGSIIANGAVVARNIPGGVVAGGSPAKLLKVLE